MDFITMKELGTSSESIINKVKQDEDIVITNDGKPTALLINIKEGSFDEIIDDLRRARQYRIIDAAREEASTRGFMTMDEIDAEIFAARREYKIKNGKYL